MKWLGDNDLFFIIILLLLLSLLINKVIGTLGQVS